MSDRPTIRASQIRPMCRKEKSAGTLLCPVCEQVRKVGCSSICVGLPQTVWLLWRSAGPRRITCPDGNAGSLMSDENQLRLGAGTGPTDLGR